MVLKIRVTGNRTLLQHNGRLANPADPYTRELKSLTGKRNKTEEDLALVMSVEARASAYETENGVLGIPTAAVWASIHDAAKAFKMGPRVGRGLLLRDPDEVVPLRHGRKTHSVDAWLADPQHTDTRAVVVQRSRVMRSRCRVTAPWVSEHEMELDEDILDLRALVPVFAYAGRYVGLGDWRPRFGTYDLKVSG